MSLIQKIRDKGALISAIIIALALLGFILMDAGPNLLGGGNSTTIGEVNGKEIDYYHFESLVKSQEDMGNTDRQQLIQSVWDQEIMRALVEEQAEELGITVGNKEMNDYLFGNNPPPDFAQRFTDPNTGAYNAQAAQQFINNIKRSGTPEDKAQANAYIESLEFNRVVEKYASLLSGTIHFAKWFIENQNTDNSLLGNVSVVSVPYTTIPDTAIKVSDKEIEQYINDHKKDFELLEEMRSIEYVIFNASPTTADSAAVRTEILKLKEDFAAAEDPKQFLTQHGSGIQYLDAYMPGSQIQIPVKDSIFSLPKGGVYGPYLDQQNYVLAKLVDSRVLPDSVKVRHILLGTNDPQSGQPLIPDSVAKAKADSIAAAIRGGADFDALEAIYSTDQVAHKDKGVMTFSSKDIQSENFAKEFGDFILLEGKAGDKKVVKTSFGYHYIEIMEQKNPEMHYKVAYLSKPIVPSDETDRTASSAASAFAGNSQDYKSFNTNYEKNLKPAGINKVVAADILPNDYTIEGLGTSRQLVKAIYAADKGDILQPERVEDNYVVAVVTEVNEPGLVSASKARNYIEPILRNRKKAEQIKQKIGKITTLESASAAIGQPVQNVDSVRFNGSNPVFGYEMKVIGATFNPANKGKVVPEALEGQAGVYVLRVNNVSATPIIEGSIEQQREMLRMQAQQGMRSPLEALKKAADIEDNRSKFY